MTCSEDLQPIVAQMKPSTEQVPAITERGRDVVVTAGAGSGKTRALVARYVALLAEGHPLRGVIAITFTEKAAREMRNRVRDQIRSYLETIGLGEAERESWQQLYGELDAARIGTIHGLCSEILRSHPAEAAIDPLFSVLDEGQANLLQSQVVDETLGWIADDPALAPLFGLLGERGLRETLGTLLGRRLDAAEAFGRMHRDVLAGWQAILEARQVEALARLIARADWRDASAAVRSNRGAAPDDLLEIQRRAASDALQAAADEGALAERLAALAGLGQIRLTGGRAGLWPLGKEQMEEIRGALKALRGLYGEAKLLQLAVTPFDETLAGAMPDLRACFDFMCSRYAGLKRAREALDFDDLEAGALALLEDNAAARARWSAETSALLVDEFQDTNDRQRRLVRCLGAGKLFVVGDAKQSIYRFRGADVTVFREERQRVARAGGAMLSLETSYRAHRQLLEGLNALLRPVLGEDEDPSRPWMEPFVRLRPHREAAGPGFTPPHIELHLALGSKSDGGMDRAAAALAARLACLVEDQEISVEADKGMRPLEYGDVAILCRASTSFAAYEDALEHAGIPFLTVAGRGFYGRPEIRDLLNALSALDDPTDDLALAGLLRSPALALSDAALFRLVDAGRGEAFPDRILEMGNLASEEKLAVTPDPGRNASPLRLWDVLREIGSFLPGEDGGCAARACRIIADLHARAGRVSVADLLKEFLDATGYRAALIAAGQTRAARNVTKLLADAHASGLVGAREFLEYVAALRDSGAREGEARSTAEGAVQILSVHAAKGMEFPIVVLGDISYGPPARRGILFDPELGVLLPQRDAEKALPAIYSLGKMMEEDQEAAESDRLLYVAATRAREKLILSGCVPTSRDGALAPSRGWLKRLDESGSLRLAGREPAADDTEGEPHKLRLSAGDAEVACLLYGQDWQAGGQRREPPASAPEPALRLPPPLLASVVPEPASADDRTMERERDPGQRVWRVVPPATRLQAAPWVIGKLVHAALALWRFPHGDDLFDRWAEAQARGYGLTDPRQLAHAVARSRELLLRFREHPLYDEMNGAEPRRHELPYSRINEEGQVESGIIDALYRHGGAWTIVEFKTDAAPTRPRLEELLEEYTPQAERYCEAVERLVGSRPRLLLCFMDRNGEIYLHPQA